MIPRKYRDLLFAIFMGFIMVFTISFANEAIKNGMTSDFFKGWLTGFCIGYPIAVPLILIIPKRINRLIEKLTTNENA